MLRYNTMRFATDVFSFGNKSGLAYCKTPFNFTDYSVINSISVSGTESADDNRRFVFYTEGKHYVLDSNGALQEIDFGSGTAANTQAALYQGNAADQLNALSNITSLAGKNVYLYSALSCPMEASAKPTAKVAFNCQSLVVVLNKTVDFSAKTFDKNIKLTAITPAITKTGNAAAAFGVKLYDGANWGSYTAIADALNKSCYGYQIRATLSVTEVNGADSVGVNSIVVRYVKGGVT